MRFFPTSFIVAGAMLFQASYATASTAQTRKPRRYHYDSKGTIFKNAIPIATFDKPGTAAVHGGSGITKVEVKRVDLEREEISFVTRSVGGDTFVITGKDPQHSQSSHLVEKPTGELLMFVNDEPKIIKRQKQNALDIQVLSKNRQGEPISTYRRQEDGNLIFGHSALDVVERLSSMAGPLADMEQTKLPSDLKKKHLEHANKLATSVHEYVVSTSTQKLTEIRHLDAADPTKSVGGFEIYPKIVRIYSPFGPPTALRGKEADKVRTDGEQKVKLLKEAIELADRQFGWLLSLDGPALAPRKIAAGESPIPP